MTSASKWRERTQSMERLLADLRLTRASDFHLSCSKKLRVALMHERAVIEARWRRLALYQASAVECHARLPPRGATNAATADWIDLADICIWLRRVRGTSRGSLLFRVLDVGLRGLLPLGRCAAHFSALRRCAAPFSALLHRCRARRSSEGKISSSAAAGASREQSSKEYEGHNANKKVQHDT